MWIWGVSVPHESIMGWDLGGAHIKAARIDGNGCVDAVIQWPCALWQGLDRLETGIDSVLERIGDDGNASRHAVTMTGELADLFADRASGVKALVETMKRRFSQQSLAIYAGSVGFLDPDNALDSALQVASANWSATASWSASRLPAGVLIDVGSTTTDLVPFRGNRVLALGGSDHQRLVRQELIYTGIVRTPLMAVTQRVPFAGEWVSLMAEHFATTADIYRLTGDLPEGVDMHPSADNGDKSDLGSARRLARMLGLDADATDLDGWRRIARYIAERQLRQLADACERLLSRSDIPADAPLVGAGVGRFLVQRICQRLDRAYVGFDTLCSCAEHKLVSGVAECAPAVAVAVLARERAA
jgi:probable H4MPT-linked C1 transfer pathway protein